MVTRTPTSGEAPPAGEVKAGTSSTPIPKGPTKKKDPQQKFREDATRLKQVFDRQVPSHSATGQRATSSSHQDEGPECGDDTQFPFDN